MNKLVLVDGNAITMAAFYALKNFVTTDGTPTGALYGFVQTILRLLDDFPSHMGIVFDKGKSNKCNVASFYKANRSEKPADLDIQYNCIREFLKIMKIPSFSNAGHEADDIIATFASKFHTELPVEVVTRDKDLFYLCSLPNVTVQYCSGTGSKSSAEIYNADKVLLKIGVRPEQITDLKALAGDVSDNIPGVNGIGDKTAVTLLTKYGSAENIYQHLEELTPKLREKFTHGRDMYDLCYKLVKLEIYNTEVPLNIFERRESSLEELNTFFRKYEFSTLIGN